MKAIFKFVLCLSLTALAACTAEDVSPLFKGGLGSKPEKISSQALQGTMNGVPWSMTRAVGKIQQDGMLLVSISGNGEVINCNYSMPLKPAVLFSVPMKVADYDFDMLRPNNGYAITWVYTDVQSQIHNVVSDMALISITSVSADRMIGGFSAKFLDPSNPGALNGVFEITICR